MESDFREDIQLGMNKKKDYILGNSQNPKKEIREES